MIENRNLILAVIISVGILMASEFYFKSQQLPPSLEDTEKAEQLADATSPRAPTDPSRGVSENIPLPSKPNGQSIAQASNSQPQLPTRLSGALDGVNFPENREATLSKTPRIDIITPRLRGSISLKGGIIDDLLLLDYRETLSKESSNIEIFNPKGAVNAYYAQFGWVPTRKTLVPTAETVWTANRKVLEPGTPVTLTWNNGDGLTFKRTFGIDENFMFTITQEIINKSSTPMTFHAFGLVSRRTTPETTGFYILHEGLLGVSNDTLTEIDYDDLQDLGQAKQSSKGGWIGITDKYWLAALVPDQKTENNSRFLHTKQQGVDTYQVDFVGPAIRVEPRTAKLTENQLFVGAKEVRLLDAYEKEMGIGRFDLAIDFGWFYFLTKPIFYALLWINNHVLNLGVSILILTVGIKLVFFPLANKSYISMSKMKKLQPKMAQIKERFGDDKMRMNQEMMDLYKKEKVNPASGCLPILIQIPVFFALYKVLFVTIEMRHAPFFGWVQDLSAPDPTTMFNLFGAIPWNPPEFMMIGIWPIIMGATMFLQQKLNPQPADPVQAKIFMFLPLFFTFLLAQFPAGLVIYWAWNNFLSIIQQWVIMRRMGLTGKEALQ
ncbi:MAG: membrane protein insertase YidC [Rhodospirillaceae bacterium TMED8]|nr:membrane protein insertase YidC [Magnetovibrio sp.]OUT51193.1 MAG: membrane protein insertase YidC [Rhodospirillaceae bacterium TMED8]|tara:strand:- start:2042 stop:3862 length:1821 start_codon:yes stop_codon:yes gene_type:complete